MQKPLLLTTLLLMALVAGFTPTAQAQTVDYSEDFEAQQSFGAPSGDFYSFLPATGDIAYVSTAEAIGTKSLYVVDNKPVGLFTFLNAPCEAAAFRFSFLLPVLPPVNGGLMGFVQTPGGSITGSSNPFFGISISSTGSVSLRHNEPSPGTSDSSSSVVGLTISTNTWYNVTLMQIGCQTSTSGQIVRGIVEFPDQQLGTFADLTHPVDDFSTLKTFIVQESASAVSIEAYLDNLAFTDAPTTAANFWCSAPGNDDFAYDFAEDVSRVDFDAAIEIDQFYEFKGSDTDFGYLGKSFGGTQSSPTTGSTHMRSYFRVEAGAEGNDANLRSSFTFIRATGTPTSPIMDKGDGNDQGDFEEHVEVRFLEVGNDWNIRFFYVSQANAVTTRTAFGPTYVGDNPNTPTSYVFDVDTVAGTVVLERIDGTDLLTAELPSIFDNDQIYGHWFVGFHSDTVLFTFRTLAIDAKGSNDYSTCIEDVNGLTSYGGDPGLDIDTLNVTDPPEPPGEDPTPAFSELSNSFGNIFGGIGSTGGAVLLGIFWILIFAAGAYGILGGSPLAIGIGSLCGFVFSIFTGLIPDILVFIVVLLAAAAVGMRLFGGGSNGADG